MLMLLAFMVVLILVLSIFTLFFALSKSQNWENSMSQTFECGFTSYFFSRFSFSIHYFLVALIFLFLDLELCVVMPLLLESSSSEATFFLMFFILGVLLLGLLEEWKEGGLDWTF